PAQGPPTGPEDQRMTRMMQMMEQMQTEMKDMRGQMMQMGQMHERMRGMMQEHRGDMQKMCPGMAAPDATKKGGERGGPDCPGHHDAEPDHDRARNAGARSAPAHDPEAHPALAGRRGAEAPRHRHGSRHPAEPSVPGYEPVRVGGQLCPGTDDGGVGDDDEPGRGQPASRCEGGGLADARSQDRRVAGRRWRSPDRDHHRDRPPSRLREASVTCRPTVPSSLSTTRRTWSRPTSDCCAVRAT